MIVPHQVKEILKVPYYTEGPVKDADGNYFFTSLTGGIIYKLDINGYLSEWVKTICPNGQVILDNGDHLVCDSKLSTLSRFSKDGKFVKNDIQGKCANADIFVPNDLIVDSHGGIYFTDSIRHHGKVGYISMDGHQQIIAENLDYPNGLALSTDGKLLFVAESYKNRILVFNLKSTGITEAEFQVFAELPQHITKLASKNLPDGIKVDKNGNVWVAHYGMNCIQVLSSSGILLHTLETGMPLTSNLFISETEVLVTGGHSEPGPGSLVKFVLGEQK